MGEKRCAVCGKPFNVVWEGEYVWHSNKSWFCSYHCTRAFDLSHRDGRMKTAQKEEQEPPKAKTPTMAKRVTPAQKAQCVEMYTARPCSPPEIAKAVGIGVNSVYKALREADVYDPARHQTQSSFDVDRPAAMRLEGLTFRQIGDALGVHETTIRKWLRKSGLR